MTRLVAVLAVLLLLVGSGTGSATGDPAGRPVVGSAGQAGLAGGPARDAPTTYTAPISPVRVVRRFQPPPTPYAAGHRGVDLATGAGAVVRAAAAGQVSFAGPVAGRGVVVIVHPDGVSTEYEPVTASVGKGEQVAGGQPIGRVRGTHGSCTANGCLHWGARRDGNYFDPLTLLRDLGPVRLLPWK